MSIKDRIACKACVAGVEIRSWLNMLVPCALQNGVIASFYSNILCFRLLLESDKDSIVNKPEGSYSGVGHDMASLDLDCAGGVMKVNSRT